MIKVTFVGINEEDKNVMLASILDFNRKQPGHSEANVGIAFQKHSYPDIGTVGFWDAGTDRLSRRLHTSEADIVAVSFNRKNREELIKAKEQLEQIQRESPKASLLLIAIEDMEDEMEVELEEAENLAEVFGAKLANFDKSAEYKASFAEVLVNDICAEIKQRLPVKPTNKPQIQKSEKKDDKKKTSMNFLEKTKKVTLLGCDQMKIINLLKGEKDSTKLDFRETPQEEKYSSLLLSAIKEETDAFLVIADMADKDGLEKAKKHIELIKQHRPNAEIKLCPITPPPEREQISIFDIDNFAKERGISFHTLYYNYSDDEDSKVFSSIGRHDLVNELKANTIKRKRDIVPKIESIFESIDTWIRKHQDSQPGACDAAQALKDSLTESVRNYTLNSNEKEFRTACDTALDFAYRSELGKAPNWHDGILPALKQLANAVISLLAKDSAQTFFKADGQEMLNDIEKAVKNNLDISVHMSKP